MADPFDLQRFVDAQETRHAYAGALAELKRGRKTGHWIWFVFPQLRGLGRSPNAQAYGIASTAEAQAYLAHPVLGPRLVECATVVAELPEGPGIERVMGSGIDATKLRSSMTLFARAAAATGRRESSFDAVLDRFFDGVHDPATERLLAAEV